MFLPDDKCPGGSFLKHGIVGEVACPDRCSVIDAARLRGGGNFLFSSSVSVDRDIAIRVLDLTKA